MNREDLSEEEYFGLLESIAPMIAKMGLKAMTMDHVAHSLGMSKRTLYEIFESKTVMIEEVLGYTHKQHMRNIRNIFDTSENVLEAMVRIFRRQRDIMQGVNVSFFRDMDKFFHHTRDQYEHLQSTRNEEIVRMFELGVRQGVFRADINFRIQARMYTMQMESLKRMEELFPPDITIVEVYDSVFTSFVRGIATPAGMRQLDRQLRAIKDKTETVKNEDKHSINNK